MSSSAHVAAFIISSLFTLYCSHQVRQLNMASYRGILAGNINKSNKAFMCECFAHFSLAYHGFMAVSRQFKRWVGRGICVSVDLEFLLYSLPVHYCIAALTLRCVMITDVSLSTYIRLSLMSSWQCCTLLESIWKTALLQPTSLCWLEQSFSTTW